MTDIVSVTPNAQSLYAETYERLLFPTWQGIVRRRPIHEYAALLENTQWLDAEAIERLQTAALRALLSHAGRRVPFYRELFRKVGFDPRSVRSRADLAELPILTREEIRERVEDLIDPAHLGRNIQKQTSGTTGVPLRFEYCNESESWRQAVRLRAYHWAGYRQGLPTLHYWGMGTRIPTGFRAVKTRIDRALRREVYFDASRQDEQSMRRTVECIARIRPHAIIAFPQALAHLARWVVDHDARSWDDLITIAGGEPLLPRDRGLIARVFGPAVYETYGSRETMLVSSECAAHAGMHLAEENLVVEVVRANGPAAPGQTGEVVVTDLHNYGMPFIRYANGDSATLGPSEPCLCGRALRRLDRVDGRCTETLRDKTGAPVPGIMFMAILNAVEAEIDRFQAVQESSGAVELRIVPGRRWAPERFAAIERRLADYFKGLPFRVVLVDTIPPDRSGKRRPVIVERAENLPNAQERA
jgi:phenylacetate-CoA ligase